MGSFSNCYCECVEITDSGQPNLGVADLPSTPNAKEEGTGVGIGPSTTCSRRMNVAIALSIFFATGLILFFFTVPSCSAQNAPMPAISQLINELRDRQYQSNEVRDKYCYTSVQTTQDIDANGQIKTTETVEKQDFFVNSHVIERAIKKNGRPFNDYDRQRETKRVTKLVEKAKRTPPGQPLEGLNTNISRIPDIITRMLGVMDVRNPRRVNWHNRPTIVLDLAGRKDANTHGLAENTSKALQGTIWIDEADHQVTHLEVTFNDDFSVAGGLIGSIEKGSTFRFDQVPVNGEVWLPTRGEGAVQARLLMVKTLRQRYYEQDYNYQRLGDGSASLKGAK